MAPQTLDQSDGEKVCGPDWIDKSIKKNKGISGLIEQNIQPAGLCPSQNRSNAESHGNMP